MDMITATQGQNLEILENQVKDNQKIVKNMKKNVRTVSDSLNKMVGFMQIGASGSGHPTTN